MKKLLKIGWLSLMIGLALSATDFAQAHEVYLLPHGRVQYDNAHSSPNPFSALENKYDKEIVFGCIGAVLFLFAVIYILTRMGFLAGALHRFMQNIKIYALPLTRITLGLSLIYSSKNQALFGPEISFSSLGAVNVLQPVILVLGCMLLLGVFSRAVALVGILIYAVAFSMIGPYLFSYFNYFAAMFLIFLAGGGVLSIDSLTNHVTGKINHSGELAKKYGGLILRLGLGLSLLYAAINVKFMHAQLSLDVIQNYNLTRYFSFDPLFIVLGAGLIEASIALLYIFGFAIRLNTLLLILVMAQSMLFFGEAVWPHLILFGLSLAIFAFGYDKYTLESKIFNIVEVEPVL